MKVYVMFDPLHEEVVCVHEDPNMQCDACKHIGWNDGYGISEREFEVVPGKTTLRDNKLNEIGI